MGNAEGVGAGGVGAGGVGAEGVGAEPVGAGGVGAGGVGAERVGAERVVSDILGAAIRAHEAMRGGDLGTVVSAARVMLGALTSGGKVLAFGNGGSAADAQHFAAELVGRFERERRAAAAVALNADTATLTAVANDLGFERVFARQIEALGAPGDVAFGISTSGRSRNVLAAFEAARGRQMAIVALTGGDGGPVGRAADVHVNVPDASTARAQEVHRTILHALCELIEREL